MDIFNILECNYKFADISALQLHVSLIQYTVNVVLLSWNQLPILLNIILRKIVTLYVLKTRISKSKD